MITSCRPGPRAGAAGLLLAALVLLGGSGCHRDLRYQERVDTLEKSRFFADGAGARPLVEGTVPRGSLKEDRIFHTGRAGEQFVATLPVAVDAELVARGRERYNIYCAPCHDQAGGGLGMVVRRGYKQPPSLHLDRLRRAPPGYFFDVMTNGFATMPSYATLVPAGDRWAITAYIRALQLSQNATLDDVPPAERARLEAAAPSAAVPPAAPATETTTHESR